MYTLGKNHSKFLLTAVCVALIGGGQAFSKPKSGLVKEEEGFYYGYGTGATAEEAAAVAKKDLIETALTSELRLKNPKASRVTVSSANAAERLPNIKATAKNPKVPTDVYYKVSVKDFQKDDLAFDKKLRDSLTPRLAGITAKGPAADKIAAATEILNQLADCGETNLLTAAAVENSDLFSARVIAACSQAISTLKFTVSVNNGIVTPDTVYSVKVTDNTGKPVAGLSVKTLWEVAALDITTDEAEVDGVAAVVKTDKDGNAAIAYPESDDFKNKIVCLTVSTAVSAGENATTEMRKLDAESAVEAHFYNVTSIEDTFRTVTVEAGAYKTGAVAQDGKKTPGKEDERDVELDSYAIDVAPVTNYQYAAFLYLSGSEIAPEYFDNSDYNQSLQPVVGITAADAEEYAAWLSEQLGASYRLPTDDEWEVAARAGQEIIYPWGDESPDKNKAANCRKNGTYTATSPVGAFASGNNAWGLVDMAGNVWEWTSSTRGDAEEGLRTVKGGSWMDGPVDLRISNYKNIDAGSTYPEVGFRLVKEIK